MAQSAIVWVDGGLKVVRGYVGVQQVKQSARGPGVPVQQPSAASGSLSDFFMGGWRVVSAAASGTSGLDVVVLERG